MTDMTANWRWVVKEQVCAYNSSSFHCLDGGGYNLSLGTQPVFAKMTVLSYQALLIKGEDAAHATDSRSKVN